MDRSRNTDSDRRRHHRDDADNDRHRDSRRDPAFKHPADHADDRHRERSRSARAGSSTDHHHRHGSRHGDGGGGGSSHQRTSRHDERSDGASSSSRHRQPHQNPFDAPSAAHLVDLAAEPPYAFRDKRNSGRQANGGTRTLDEDYLESRRLEREAIATAGVDSVWGRSPTRAVVSSDDEETVAKRKASKKKAKKARKAAKKAKKGKKSKKSKRKADASSDDCDSSDESDSSSADISDAKKHKRSSKKTNKSKSKSSKKSKKRRAASSSDDSSSSSSDSDDSDAEVVWTEKLPGKSKKKSSAALTDGGHLPAGAGTAGDIQIGPAVQKGSSLTYKDFGHALLPGEGAAMAAYIADGKRIPRRGEIGLTADEISTYEDVGYVMSGNRHRRMEAVRIRKENQIYTADEKRALAMFSREERMKRETKILGQFKEMVQAKLGKND